jgi:glycosyltransferase involved in cell wall biosynthesis
MTQVDCLPTHVPPENSTSTYAARIAFVSTMTHDPWGGSEELWHAAATHLLRQRHVVAATAIRRASLPSQIVSLEQLGCELHWRAAKPSLLSRVARRLCGDNPCAWFDRFRPDLVFVSLALHGGGLQEMLACKARGIPYVVNVQCASPCMWPDDDILDTLRYCYGNARACLFVSRHNQRVVECELGMHLPNARVVQNPFKVSYKAQCEWPDTQAGWKLACVARLDAPSKGQDLLFHVLAKPQWRERPVSVSLVGTGCQERALKRLVDFLGVRTATFKGFQKDIEAVWAEHHCLVLSSRMEGLPLALVEAMLCARPAIVTDVGGNAELIEDGKSGFVAPAPSVAALEETMERAWQSRERWREMGIAASERVRQMVPADPGAALADDLLSFVQSTRTSSQVNKL